MTKRMFALLVAGTLTFPHITPALGNDATVALGGKGANWTQIWAALSLPPVPHLETMPWLTSDSFLRGPKIDLLLGPKIETLGPFLVAPSIPPRHFSSINPPPQE
jgi:hypothetical protein